MYYTLKEQRYIFSDITLGQFLTWGLRYMHHITLEGGQVGKRLNTACVVNSLNGVELPMSVYFVSPVRVKGPRVRTGCVTLALPLLGSVVACCLLG